MAHVKSIPQYFYIIGSGNGISASSSFSNCFQLKKSSSSSNILASCSSRNLSVCFMMYPLCVRYSCQQCIILGQHCQVFFLLLLKHPILYSCQQCIILGQHCQVFFLLLLKHPILYSCQQCIILGQHCQVFFLLLPMRYFTANMVLLKASDTLTAWQCCNHLPTVYHNRKCLSR